MAGRVGWTGMALAAALAVAIPCTQAAETPIIYLAPGEYTGGAVRTAPLPPPSPPPATA